MHESKASTPLRPPNYGSLNQNKSHAFDLDDHKTRTFKVFEDFDEYRRILGDLEKRVEALEEITKEDSDTER